MSQQCCALLIFLILQKQEGFTETYLHWVQEQPPSTSFVHLLHLIVCMANDLLHFHYIAWWFQKVFSSSTSDSLLLACLMTYLMTCLQVLPSHRRMAAAAYDVHESIQPCRQVLMAWRTSLFQVDRAAHQKSWFLSSHVAFPDDSSTTCHITSASRVYMLVLQRKQQCTLNTARTNLQTTCRAV